MGHFLDLDTRALGLFRLPLALAALSLFLGPLAAFLLRRRARPHAANLALAAGAFGFLLAAHLGLQTFAPVLTSAQLAEAIAPQVHPNDLIVIHGEYEAGSTLAFYLQRPSNVIPERFSHKIAPAATSSTSSKAAAPTSGTAASSPTPPESSKPPPPSPPNGPAPSASSSGNPSPTRPTNSPPSPALFTFS